jgi:hypothetical protein
MTPSQETLEQLYGAKPVYLSSLPRVIQLAGDGSVGGGLSDRRFFPSKLQPSRLRQVINLIIDHFNGVDPCRAPI